MRTLLTINSSPTFCTLTIHTDTSRLVTFVSVETMTLVLALSSVITCRTLSSTYNRIDDEKYNCGVIKQNQSEVGNIQFSVSYWIVVNSRCIMLHYIYHHCLGTIGPREGFILTKLTFAVVFDDSCQQHLHIYTS